MAFAGWLTSGLALILVPPAVIGNPLPPGGETVLLLGLGFILAAASMVVRGPPDGE